MEIGCHRVDRGFMSLEAYKDRNRKTDFVRQAAAEKCSNLSNYIKATEADVQLFSVPK